MTAASPDHTASSGGLTHVVAAVLRRRGRYLLAQRPPDKVHGGCWEFPGGKLEPGENSAAGLRRELAEELGMTQVNVGAERARISAAPEAALFVQFLEVRSPAAALALEHTALGWYRPAEALLLPLAPLDRRFVTDFLV